MSGERCCGGHCTRVRPIRVMRSDLTGRAYALTRYTVNAGRINASEKHDVSEDVAYLMQVAWNQGWDACAAASKGETVDNPYAPGGEES